MFFFLFISFLKYDVFGCMEIVIVNLKFLCGVWNVCFILIFIMGSILDVIKYNENVVVIVM